MEEFGFLIDQADFDVARGMRLLQIDDPAGFGVGPLVNFFPVLAVGRYPDVQVAGALAEFVGAVEDLGYGENYKRLRI